jgi:hypothetical protein
MEEINTNKTRSIAVAYLCGTIGFIIFFVYLLIRLIRGKDNIPFGEKLIAIAIFIIFLLFLTKTFFEVLVTLLRFYNLRIEILRHKLILRTDTKECEIPSL